MVGDAPTTSPPKSLAAGLADLGAAAAVLVVGGDIAAPGVPPDGVVVGADHLQFGAALLGVADAFQVGPLALDVPEEALDGGLVGGGVGAAEVLDDGAQRQELPGRPRGHLGAVVGHRQQQRPGGVVSGQVHPAVLAGGHQFPQPLALQGIGEHDLDLAGGLLGAEQGSQPLAADQVDDRERVGAARQRPKWVTSQPHTWLGRYSSQSGQGCRCTGARVGGVGSTRSWAASTRYTLAGETHTRPSREPRWASLRCERSISPHSSASSRICSTSSASRPWTAPPPAGRSASVPAARRACQRLTRRSPTCSTRQAACAVNPSATASSTSPSSACLVAAATRGGTPPINPSAIFPAAASARSPAP